jgi:hypothetical protein
VESSPVRAFTSSLELVALPSAIPLARVHAARVLRAWAVPDDVVETAELLVSELTTNALAPGSRDHRPTYPELQSGVARFWLNLRSTRTSLYIEVRDTKPSTPKRRPQPCPRPGIPSQPAPKPAPLSAQHEVAAIDEGGRGLILIEALSRRWGYFFSDDHNFKTVWCELTYEPARRHP